MMSIEYTPFYSYAPDIYNLAGFEPVPADKSYLEGTGADVRPSDGTLAALGRGSKLFIRRYKERKLLPETRFVVVETDLLQIEDEIHNYTGRCPSLTYEINPVLGCGAGCQYCLVSDGVHERELTVIGNYHLYVRALLERMNGKGSPNKEHYYYFSPKTEALQEASLLSGAVHDILREFISHFEHNPDSKARLFMATKAGIRHLQYSQTGVTVADLMEQLKGRMQFNTSLSIMPATLRSVLEPYTAPLEDRLEAVKICRSRGISATSALVQPIMIPFLDEDEIKKFFNSLRQAGIVNYKPEFLTVCPENLAMTAQLAGYFDKNAEKQLYEQYLQPANASHIKQRMRTAPDRGLCKDALARMRRYTDTLGMSISICYWVRMQLGIGENDIPLVNSNGYQCLGYQRKLFG